MQTKIKILQLTAIVATLLFVLLYPVDKSIDNTEILDWYNVSDAQINVIDSEFDDFLDDCDQDCSCEEQPR